MDYISILFLLTWNTLIPVNCCYVTITSLFVRIVSSAIRTNTPQSSEFCWFGKLFFAVTLHILLVRPSMWPILVAISYTFTTTAFPLAEFNSVNFLDPPLESKQSKTKLFPSTWTGIKRTSSDAGFTLEKH